EIERVGDAADVDERSTRQEGCEPAPRLRQIDEHDRARDRERRRDLPQLRDERGERDEDETRRHEPADARQESPRERVARGAADDDRVEDRRAEVEEPPFAADGERDPRGEESADDQGETAEQAAGGDPAPQQHDEERRPEEVEVLLDRERPQLPEAALLVQDSGGEEGVREVENPGDRGQERPRRVVARSDAGRGLGEADRRWRRDRDEERRQQPERASPPELPQRDGSRSVPL